MLLGIAILNNKKENQVCFKKHCFSVELAETSAERSKGLMFREQLDEDKGMLFVFPAEQEASFWMKNTLIPLDIIWFNENKEVLFIKKDAQPCGTDKCLSINSGVEAQYILELNAGVADEIGLIIGDKAIFDFTVSADSL
ncbi:DUF192 domain-containing protein [Candidatus Parcubacteria bacterium]|nr:DUF192 domain-containing protein [Candidatus Parcubacteria bacterium]